MIGLFSPIEYFLVDNYDREPTPFQSDIKAVFIYILNIVRMAKKKKNHIKLSILTFIKRKVRIQTLFCDGKADYFNEMNLFSHSKRRNGWFS